MNFSRSQPNTPRGASGIETRAPLYGRDYPPLRSRSQTNMDQDYGDRYTMPAPYYDNRALDRSARSKSLDAREFRGDEYPYRDDYANGPVMIPIRRESARRPLDVRDSPQLRQREMDPIYPVERPGPDIHIPYNNRDREFGASRRQYESGFPGDSPRSFSSRLQDRRPYEYDDRRFQDEFDRDDLGPVVPAAPPAGTLHPYRTGGSGAYRSSSHHRSHHESHGGGHDASFGQSRIVGAPITQQPQMFHHADGRPVRPIQHHRVHCCCFNFVWPPWSYEQAPPPQQIYRNI
ncbi:unnamed protein product [Caenorhabditis bovis]|uniref:Uncharacterized protein n=1 Tax=Caenorhabditis bovis TaxID=2654633 RepID=A0A8S1EHX5_9PELO|nr:unnamed protein product [Caenorhabditis bovis]